MEDSEENLSLSITRLSSISGKLEATNLKDPCLGAALVSNDKPTDLIRLGTTVPRSAEHSAQNIGLGQAA